MMDAHGDDFMDLFKAKIVKGWWPMKGVTKDGTTIIKVRGRKFSACSHFLLFGRNTWL